jgi:hypothetical protein
LEKEKIREEEKPEMGISSRREKTADFVSSAKVHFLLCRRMSGNGNFPAGVRAATRVAATDFITEIIITTPPLTGSLIA